MILNFPHLGITDVLTSGFDPSDSLAGLGVPGTYPAVGEGVAGETVNTLMNSMTGQDFDNSPFTSRIPSPGCGTSLLRTPSSASEVNS